jgi:hypothetical protein
LARLVAPDRLDTSDRVLQTVMLLGRRGYALSPPRLAQVCIGGSVAEADVRWAVAARPGLAVEKGLVMLETDRPRAGAIASRTEMHHLEAPRYRAMTGQFVHALVAVAPFIRSVAIAGSLASGGFKASDDVDLNLIVDDGHRHLAYVAVNALGVLHALRHRSKPVDDLTRRPVAPRLMTANLILERSQCRPLVRQDEDMAFELLMSEPLFGHEVYDDVLESNPGLMQHFPQLAGKLGHANSLPVRPSLPLWLFPGALDGIARWIGGGAWRYMQWTRRHRPEALARVEFVRRTMRPYTLFDT